MMRRRRVIDEDNKKVETIEEKPVETAEVDKDEFKIVISVKIGQNIIEQDIGEALYIPTINKLNPATISKIMSENPSQHARWNALYNEAVYTHDMLKTKFEIWTAKKGRVLRSELNKIAKEEKIRVTDKLVDDTLKSEPEYESISQEIAEAKKNMKHILALANGFGEKGEKIINIASMMKWEAEILAGNKRVGSGNSYSAIEKKDSKSGQEKEYNTNMNSNGGWPTKN